METPTVTINVLAERAHEARARLAKLVKKAKRYAVNPVTFAEGEPTHERRAIKDWDGETREVRVRVVPFTVTGLRPVIGKHAFLARLEHTDAGNILSSLPGSETPVADRYRASKPCCEHCNTRRARRDTFVILDRETDEQKQVGRSCLAEYVQTGSAASIIASLGHWGEGEEIDRAFGVGSAFLQTLESVVTATVIAIRKFGWLSRAQASEMEPSTSSHVASLWGTSNEARKVAAALYADWQAGDDEMGRKVISWVRHEMKGDNDYVHNLRVSYANDAITSPRMIGLICSGVAAYQRDQEQLVRREFERQKMLRSRHVGEVGERLRGVDVTYLSSRGLGENGFGGFTMLHKFITAEGDLLSWITGNSMGRGVEQGHTFKLTGTVKQHREYAGIKETSVSRVKLG